MAVAQYILQPATVSTLTTPANPTGLATAGAYKMAGLKIYFTPNWTGLVKVTIDGSAMNNTGGDQCNMYIGYGTGTAPNNGDAATGSTVANPVYTYQTSSYPSQPKPFAMTRIIGSLTPGTKYWFDILIQAYPAGTATIAQLTMTIEEIQY